MSMRGFLLASTAKNEDTGLWFVFHHQEDGILAFDVTREHPDVPYQRFASVLTSEDRKAQEDKIVLLGGPLESDKSMIVLHNRPQANKDSHIINDDFSFLSYRYVVIPGKPPTLTTPDNKPSRIELGEAVDFIVSIGFKLWEKNDLEQEMKDGLWQIIPATPAIIFQTSHRNRLERARLSVN